MKVVGGWLEDKWKLAFGGSPQDLSMTKKKRAFAAFTLRGMERKDSHIHRP